MLNCKFCSKECKNKISLSGHQRLCINNPNKVESNLFKHNNTPGVVRINGAVKSKMNGLSRKDFLTDEGRERLRQSSKKIRHSEETKKKISEARIRFLNANPDKVPFKLTRPEKESYPEKYFREVFEKEQLIFEPQKPISRFNLDFAFETKMIDFEVNGELHYTKKCRVKDLRRKEYLEKLGWTVIELRWSEYVKLDPNIKRLYINDLLETLR